MASAAESVIDIEYISVGSMLTPAYFYVSPLRSAEMDLVDKAVLRMEARLSIHMQEAVVLEEDTYSFPNLYEAIAVQVCPGYWRRGRVIRVIDAADDDVHVDAFLVDTGHRVGPLEVRRVRPLPPVFVVTPTFAALKFQIDGKSKIISNLSPRSCHLISSHR